ncbi:unnamed protein product [Boreogadus saida]
MATVFIPPRILSVSRRSLITGSRSAPRHWSGPGVQQVGSAGGRVLVAWGTHPLCILHPDGSTPRPMGCGQNTADPSSDLWPSKRHNTAVKRAVVSGRGREGGGWGPRPFGHEAALSHADLRVRTGGVARWQADPLLQASRDENRDEEERYILKGFSSNVKGRILHVDVFGK